MSTSAQAFHAQSARFLKTKLCTFYLRGQCDRGEACKFAHGVDAMAPIPNLYKTRLCNSFVKKLGRCPDGDSCQFAHSREELRPVTMTPSCLCSPQLQAFDHKAAPVQQGTRGGDGEEKTVRALKSPLLKVDLCRFYVQGRCLRGENCTFAHGEDELQARPDLRCTSPCFKFWTSSKCKDDCKFSHSLESLRGKCKKSICEGDDFFTSSIWSRPTSVADLDSVGQWSRQTSLALTEYASLASASQDFDERLIQQIAEESEEAATDAADFEITGQEKESVDDDLDHEEISTACSIISSSIPASMEAEERLPLESEYTCPPAPCLRPARSPSILAPELKLPEASSDEFVSLEDMVSHECARLQGIGKLALNISVKNTFLAFEECDNMCGTATSRARSV